MYDLVLTRCQLISEKKTASNNRDAPSVLPADSRLVDRSILDSHEGENFSEETIDAFSGGSPRTPSLTSDREAPNEGLVIHRPKSVMEQEPNNAFLPRSLYPNLSIYTDESNSISGPDSESRYSITSLRSLSQLKETHEMASSSTDLGMEGCHQPGLELPILQNGSVQETQTRITRMRCDTLESNATYATLPSYRSKASGSLLGSSLGEIPPPLPRPLPLVPLASSEAGISQMTASTSTHSQCHDKPSGHTWPFHLPL